MPQGTQSSVPPQKRPRPVIRDVERPAPAEHAQPQVRCCEPRETARAIPTPIRAVTTVRARCVVAITVCCAHERQGRSGKGVGEKCLGRSECPRPCKPRLAPEDAYQRFCEHVGDDAHLIQKPGESFKMFKERLQIRLPMAMEEEPPQRQFFFSRSQRKAIRMGAATACSTLPRHARLRLRAVVLPESVGQVSRIYAYQQCGIHPIFSLKSGHFPRL